MKIPQACVIGAGPAGYVCALRLARLGVETVLVEKESRLGGVCLNAGCIPSKAYISAARLWRQLGTAKDMGITVEEPALDLARMKTWKDGIVTRLTGGIAELLRRNGVTVICGTATFTGRDTLSIQATDGSRETLRASRFVIATGSRSTDIPGFEVDEETILSSTGALDLTALPRSLLVIGGGAIGLEIGQYLQAFGTRLAVVELLDQLLPGADPDCVKVLSRRLKKDKTRVFLGSRAVGASSVPGGLSVTIETRGGTKTVEVEKVLVAVGRRPITEDLGLDRAGVETDPRGFITVNDRLRTTNPAIHAIGDVTGPPLLAHKGSKQGTVAAAVIAGRPAVYDVRALPAAVFTEPEIAFVGLTASQAEDRKLDIRTGTFPFAASGRALAAGETEGLVKLIADTATDTLLGAHIAGPHASELIAEAALALEAGLTAEDLALTIHTHPTLAETLMEAADDLHGLALHIYNPRA